MSFLFIKKKQQKIIVIFLLIVVMFFLFFFKMNENTPPKIINIQYVDNSKTLITPRDTISVTILAGDKKANAKVSPGASLYDALVLAQKNKDIVFIGKNYSGLGFFVTSVGTLSGGNGKYLFYSVNSKEASVGVSSYILKDGDIIEWKLK